MHNVQTRNICINVPSWQTSISRNYCLETQYLSTIKIIQNINTVHGQNAVFCYVETGGLYIDHSSVRVKMINYLSLSYKSVLYSADESYHSNKEIRKTHARNSMEIVWQSRFFDVSNRASVEGLLDGPGHTPHGDKIVVVGGCKNKHGTQILKFKGKGNLVGSGWVPFAQHRRLSTQVLRSSKH